MIDVDVVIVNEWNIVVIRGLRTVVIAVAMITCLASGDVM